MLPEELTSAGTSLWIIGVGGSLQDCFRGRRFFTGNARHRHTYQYHLPSGRSGGWLSREMICFNWKMVWMNGSILSFSRTGIRDEAKR